MTNPGILGKLAIDDFRPFSVFLLGSNGVNWLVFPNFCSVGHGHLLAFRYEAHSHFHAYTHI